MLSPQSGRGEDPSSLCEEGKQAIRGPSRQRNLYRKCQGIVVVELCAYLTLGGFNGLFCIFGHFGDYFDRYFDSG